MSNHRYENGAAKYTTIKIAVRDLQRIRKWARQAGIEPDTMLGDIISRERVRRDQLWLPGVA